MWSKHVHMLSRQGHLRICCCAGNTNEDGADIVQALVEASEEGNAQAATAMQTTAFTDGVSAPSYTDVSSSAD